LFARSITSFIVIIHESLKQGPGDAVAPHRGADELVLRVIVETLNLRCPVVCLLRPGPDRAIEVIIIVEFGENVRGASQANVPSKFALKIN
jgi:hypothetical protein